MSGTKKLGPAQNIFGPVEGQNFRIFGIILKYLGNKISSQLFFPPIVAYFFCQQTRVSYNKDKCHPL